MLDLLMQLPAQYRRDPWVRALLDAVAAKDRAQRARADEIAAQILLDTLTVNLVTEERIAGITPSRGAALEDRLSALAAKWRSGGKVDIDQIQLVCDAWRKGNVSVDYQDNRLVLRFVDLYGVPEDFDGLKNAVGAVCPAHIPVAYIILYRLWRELASQSWGALKNHTWADVKAGEL